MPINKKLTAAGRKKRDAEIAQRWASAEETLSVIAKDHDISVQMVSIIGAKSGLTRLRVDAEKIGLFVHDQKLVIVERTCDQIIQTLDAMAVNGQLWQYDNKLHEWICRDLDRPRASDVRQLATVFGILVDKLQILTGEANQITQNESTLTVDEAKERVAAVVERVAARIAA